MGKVTSFKRRPGSTSRAAVEMCQSLGNAVSYEPARTLRAELNRMRVAMESALELMDHGAAGAGRDILAGALEGSHPRWLRKKPPMSDRTEPPRAPAGQFVLALPSPSEAARETA